MLAHTNFLRVSSESQNISLEITPIATGAVPSITAGAELAALADAMTTKTDSQPVAERAALVAVIGDAGAERAVSVVATFQMMNRLLDGVGAPIRSALGKIALELGFEPEDIPRTFV